MRLIGHKDRAALVEAIPLIDDRAGDAGLLIDDSLEHRAVWAALRVDNGGTRLNVHSARSRQLVRNDPRARVIRTHPKGVRGKGRTLRGEVGHPTIARVE